MSMYQFFQKYVDYMSKKKKFQNSDSNTLTYENNQQQTNLDNNQRYAASYPGQMQQYGQHQTYHQQHHQQQQIGYQQQVLNAANQIGHNINIVGQPQQYHPSQQHLSVVNQQQPSFSSSEEERSTPECASDEPESERGESTECFFFLIEKLFLDTDSNIDEKLFSDNTNRHK